MPFSLYDFRYTKTLSVFCSVREEMRLRFVMGLKGGGAALYTLFLFTGWLFIGSVHSELFRFFGLRAVNSGGRLSWRISPLYDNMILFYIEASSPCVCL